MSISDRLLRKFSTWSWSLCFVDQVGAWVDSTTAILGASSIKWGLRRQHYGNAWCFVDQVGACVDSTTAMLGASSLKFWFGRQHYGDA